LGDCFTAFKEFTFTPSLNYYFMPDYSVNGGSEQLTIYETPFADPQFSKEFFPESETSIDFTGESISSVESPFKKTFEINNYTPQGISPFANEQAELLAELFDNEFPNHLYALASEVEDTWTSKLTSEITMGERFMPFARQQADKYFANLLNETDSMIDRVSERFSGNDYSKYTENEIDNIFNEIHSNQSQLTPVQEQFFGSLVKKVKSVVKKGVDLAKKGVQVIKKLSPIHLILNRLKRLIRPLLDKVLRFAMGKLPKSLQPYAQMVARKYLKIETPPTDNKQQAVEIPTTADLGNMQADFDNNVTDMFMAEDESAMDELVTQYETGDEEAEREMNYGQNGSNGSLDEAREKFVNELKELRDGDSPAPAIERFLPVAIMALKPAIKLAIRIVGRQRVINFLAGHLSKLVGPFVPKNIAKPLAVKIVDAGMVSIGFETADMENTDVAYEAIANTIENTVQNLGELDEASLDNEDQLTVQLMEAFETAAANNFPAEYIREELRPTSGSGVWILKPRKGKGPKHYYKKYSRVFSITIDPATANEVTIFRQIPLANFLKDKLGLDPAKPIEARVHLYEAINDTRLSRISRFENVPGLGERQPYGWKQLLPLTKQAAALLLKEPGLGRDFSQQHQRNRYKIAVGQRFYFLQINGARLRIPPVARGQHNQNGNDLVQAAAAHSGDVQGVINFIKSTIKLNYYFSEEEARAVMEKVNSNDYIGAAANIRGAIAKVLNSVLLLNISNKVRIIHESYPEQNLESFSGGVIAKAGKGLLTNLVENVIANVAGAAYRSVLDFLKSRAAEFKQAQAQPQDGVTIKISWNNIAGMSAMRAMINGIKGKLSVPNLADLSIPTLPPPEISVVAGKNFD
jgi:hypothetical protein